MTTEEVPSPRTTEPRLFEDTASYTPYTRLVTIVLLWNDMVLVEKLLIWNLT